MAGLVDRCEFLGAKADVSQRTEVVFDLAPAAGPDENAGDPGLGEEPGDGHLGQRLAARHGDFSQGADAAEFLFRHLFRAQESIGLAGPGLRIDAIAVTPSQQTLGEGAERNAADALLLENVGQSVLHPAVEKIADRLMNQEVNPLGAEDFSGAAGEVCVVAGDADVEGFAGTDGADQGSHRFFERCLGIGAVAIENIDVIQPHAQETLIQAGQQVFARPPLAIGTGPHVISGLG